MIHCLTVTHSGISDMIAPDQPVLAIDIHVLFKAVIALTMLLRPARIDILLAKLGGLICSNLGHFALLDRRVLVAPIVVAKHRHDGNIQDLPAAGYVALSIEMVVEQLE